VASGFGQVSLVGDDEKGAPGQTRVVLPKFLAEETVVFGGVPSLRAGGVDDEEQNGAPLDMAEKIVA